MRAPIKRRPAYRARTTRYAATSKRYRRKAYSRKRKQGRRSTAWIRGGFLEADQLFVKLKYTYTGTDVTASGAYLEHVFRGNSAYDVDYTLTGHQPTGFDQYCEFYQNCYVVGSAVRCEIINGAAAFANAYCYPSTDPTMAYVATSMPEIKYCKTKHLGINSSPNSRTLIKHYMSSSKMFSISKGEVVDNALYGHSTSGNPTNPWYWHVGVVPYTGGVLALTYVMKCTIILYCVFKNRQEMQPS